MRKAAIKTIMAAGYLDIIKGNEREIATIYGETSTQQKGVDSTSTLSPAEKATLVSKLAARERNVVVMTGATDYVSDGRRTFSVANGHEYLGVVTGTGCVLGTVISAMVTVFPEDKLAAAVAGLLLFEVAAETAAVRQDVEGPGTFQAAFVDELWKLRRATTAGDWRWLSVAKVTAIDVAEVEV